MRFVLLSLLALFFGCYFADGRDHRYFFWNSGQRGDADDADDDLLVRLQTGDPDRYCARNVGHNNMARSKIVCVDPRTSLRTIGFRTRVLLRLWAVNMAMCAQLPSL
jgi:hypothetical protein